MKKTYTVSALNVSKPEYDLSAYVRTTHRTKADAKRKITQLLRAGVYQQISLKEVEPEPAWLRCAKNGTHVGGTVNPFRDWFETAFWPSAGESGTDENKERKI